MRLLLVEDDRMIGESLQRALRLEGYAVDWVRDAPVASGTLASERFDLVLLDLGLPSADGLDVLRALRARHDATPVIVLTARDDRGDRVAGLDAGADDYLTKPFAPKELSARIRALLRRIRPISTAHAKLIFGDLEIVPDEGKVLRSGVELHLTKTEFRLLCELADQSGRVLSRQQLLDRVWGYDVYGDERLVDVHVGRLRRKVERDAANPEHVLTVRGLGYKLTA